MYEEAPGVLILLLFLVLLVTAVTSLIFGWPVDMSGMTWPDEAGP